MKKLKILSVIGLFALIGACAYPGFIDGRERSLPIPPILKDRDPSPNRAEFYLSAQEGKSEFFKDLQTDTLGYNGNYLGPLIRVKNGERVVIHVSNRMNESTTVHWHGLVVPGEMDGGLHQVINPGRTWTARFTIRQKAASAWYHPHLLSHTGEQVYRGLAGLFYIDDEESERLPIPKTYGVDDIPLIIQDRRFTRGGSIVYKTSMMDTMTGVMGNIVLVNGAVNPVFLAKRGWLRLRIYNGSNARIYKFHFHDGRRFYQIASDSGFLTSPVPMRLVKLAPAERAEIMLNLDRIPDGGVLFFQSDGVTLMKIVVKGENSRQSVLPKVLTTIDRLSSDKVRRFDLSMDMGVMYINNQSMDMSVTNEVVKLGSTEIWEIRNLSGMKTGMMGGMIRSSHPFHVHGVVFQVLSRNGALPPPNERGWKDTILVNPGKTVRIIAKFTESGLFMYHCHILEHEDAGMMGQFIVKK